MFLGLVQSDIKDVHFVLFPSMKEQARLLEEQRKYGIDFDDGYNYLQHLKSVSELYNSEMIEVRKSL